MKRYSVTVEGSKLSAETDEDGSVFIEGVQLPSARESRGELWKRTVRIGSEEVPVYVRRGESDREYVVYVRGETIRVELETERDARLKELSRSTASVRNAGQVVRAPMPGLIKAVLVEPGRQVEKGTPICILEAMKMENEIKSPGGYTIRQVHVKAGQTVEKGMPIVELSPPEGEQ